MQAIRTPKQAGVLQSSSKCAQSNARCGVCKYARVNASVQKSHKNYEPWRIRLCSTKTLSRRWQLQGFRTARQPQLRSDLHTPYSGVRSKYYLYQAFANENACRIVGVVIHENASGPMYTAGAHLSILTRSGYTVAFATGICSSSVADAFVHAAGSGYGCDEYKFL